jgi:hypothetical protein
MPSLREGPAGARNNPFDLRTSPTHCETSTFWQEFDIYIEIRRRKFIGIGALPEKPQRLYESPLREALLYQRLLSGPFMALLKLPEKIQRVLLGLDDQKAIRHFSERRLRPLLAIPDPTRQVREFNRMLNILS